MHIYRQSDRRTLAGVLAERALTRSCYARDVNRLRTHAHQPLNQISVGDLLSFAQSLSEAGLAPISHARSCEKLVRILPAHA